MLGAKGWRVGGGIVCFQAWWHKLWFHNGSRKFRAAAWFLCHWSGCVRVWQCCFWIQLPKVWLCWQYQKLNSKIGRPREPNNRYNAFGWAGEYAEIIDSKCRNLCVLWLIMLFVSLVRIFDSMFCHRQDNQTNTECYLLLVTIHWWGNAELIWEDAVGSSIEF